MLFTIKSISYTIFLVVTVFVSMPLFAQEKINDSFSENEMATIKKLALEALLENPEILQEASRILQAREEQKKNDNVSKQIREYSSELTDTEDTVVIGNPDGDITIIEFFDYNCPYCKTAAKDLQDLIKSDSQIKFIPREWPILNNNSVIAAKAALAAIAQGKYKEYHLSLIHI